MAFTFLGMMGLIPQALEMGSLLANAFTSPQQMKEDAQTMSNFYNQDAETKAFFDKQEAELQMKTAELNTMLAERDAVSITKYGINKATEIREQVDKIKGSQVADFAAAGMDVSSGSPLEVYAETVYKGEKSAAQEIYNGNAAAKRIKLEAMFGEMQAHKGMRISELKGQSYKRSAMIKGQTEQNLAIRQSQDLLYKSLLLTSKAIPGLAKSGAELFE